jgi:hypothetical protein
LFRLTGVQQLQYRSSSIKFRSIAAIGPSTTIQVEGVIQDAKSLAHFLAESELDEADF